MAEDNALTIWRSPSHMREERARGTSKELRRASITCVKLLWDG
jgi:hypothetical protein